MTNLATWITASRFPLTIVMLILFFQNSRDLYLTTLAVFALAVISDILDGYIARKFGQVSKFGSRLDALLDKIMVYGMIFSLFYAGIYNPAVVFAMFFRDMLADGLRNYAYEVAESSGSNFWGKAKFACQSISIGLGLMFCIEPEYSQCVWLANAFLILGFSLSLPGLLNIVSMSQQTTDLHGAEISLHSAVTAKIAQGIES
jgi:CDP-diacylglycerol--glycerol-3-phosphate 3-phosphatidyltransferase